MLCIQKVVACLRMRRAWHIPVCRLKLRPWCRMKAILWRSPRDIINFRNSVYYHITLNNNASTGLVFQFSHKQTTIIQNKSFISCREKKIKQYCYFNSKKYILPNIMRKIANHPYLALLNASDYATHCIFDVSSAFAASFSFASEAYCVPYFSSTWWRFGITYMTRIFIASVYLRFLFLFITVAFVDTMQLKLEQCECY